MTKTNYERNPWYLADFSSDQSTATPMVATALAKDTMSNLWKGLLNAKAIKPVRDSKCNIVLPLWERHQFMKGVTARKIGESEDINASSCPAMPSSQTEK